MSVIPPHLSRSLQFYLSGPLPCPYLPGQVERKLFAKFTGDAVRDQEINAGLTRAGFRRSHDIVYRPACPTCNACVPVRIPVRQFEASSSLRRIARYNADLTLSMDPSEPTAELFDLFVRYQTARHADGDMARMNEADFAAMLREGQASSRLFVLRDKSDVAQGVMLADVMDDGYSAVYSFFTPEAAKRSLGAQLILTLITAALEQNLPYVYLGYWIAASRKMNYKARFRPLQALGPHGWEWQDDAASDHKPQP